MKPLHVLMAISVAVMWGMGFIVAKAAMGHFSPILLMALRFTVTTLCLVSIFPPPKSLIDDFFWIALVSAAIQYSLTFTGVNGIDASTAALLVQLEVPFGLLMAWFMIGEKLSVRQFVGIAVSFSGAVLILGEPKLEDNIIYAFMVIGGAFTWAVGQVMIKRIGELNGFKLISGVAVFATPQLYLASALFETGHIEQIQTASISAWAAVAYLGIIMTSLAYAIWYYLLGVYSVNKVMPYLLLLPVTSVAGSVWLLDESITLKIAIGGALAVLGVAIITIQFGRKIQEA